MSHHRGISCDLCQTLHFPNRRYKCLICHDFDLCSHCYDNQMNLSFQIHSIHHPMQLILTANDYEQIYFGQKRTFSTPVSLTCPFCNGNGFPLNDFIQHVNERHSTATNTVLCPICFTRQNHLTRHLRQHIEENDNLKNKRAYSVKTEFRSLLDEHTLKYSNENPDSQRFVFIHALLTDLLNCESLNRYADTYFSYHGPNPY
ncbi:unnamed protein product [Adineta ricciae]|uniref:RING-type E3 ubiquitin transferase n=1 Tax=Adineta ricciae TaxID=249248 RepID=A0A815F6L5_ADIRI|nr:unnamed protein product [Adineta ricciae]